MQTFFAKNNIFLYIFLKRRFLGRFSRVFSGKRPLKLSGIAYAVVNFLSVKEMEVIVNELFEGIRRNGKQYDTASRVYRAA